METLQSLPAHAHVHTTDGPLGTLESVGAHPADAAEQLLIVRSAEGQLYRIPAHLISRVKRDAHPAVIVLSGRLSAMDTYLVTGGQNAATQVEALDDGLLRIPLLAEQLVVRKDQVQLASLRLHKGVESIPEMRQLPAFREEVVVDRISIDAYNRGGAASADEYFVPIYEEQVVVEKRTVVKEYVRIRKQWIEEQRTVRGTVRRERVDIQERPAE